MRKVFKYDAIDSTNVALLKIADELSLNSGTVVMAKAQSKGKGQLGRVWHSEYGKNLTFSLLLKCDNLEIGRQFVLNKAISIGIINFLSSFSDEFKIKWPNDIYYQNKKIAGILIENSVVKNNIKHSIVGVGLNVNQRVFPSDLPNATSLSNIFHKKFDIDLILEGLSEHIEKQFENICNNKSANIDTLYKNKLYRLNRVAAFSFNGQVFNGIIKGVDSFGRLALEMEDQTVRFYNHGEIKFMI